MRIMVFIFQQPSLIGYSWSIDALREAGLLSNQVQAKAGSLCQVKAPVLPPTENFRARLHPCIMAQPWFYRALTSQTSQLACSSGLTVLATGWALFPGFASDIGRYTCRCVNEDPHKLLWPTDALGLFSLPSKGMYRARILVALFFLSDLVAHFTVVLYSGLFQWSADTECTDSHIWIGTSSHVSHE